MTANTTLKARHSEYLCIGLLCAIVIHAVAFAFWPEYVPRAYTLKKDAVTRWVPIPKIPDIRLPPKEIEPPVRPALIMPSDDADLDETIAPTLFGDFGKMPLIPPPPPAMEDDFIAFDDPPELVHAVKPIYPDIARKAGVEGLVVVIVLLDEAGNVISAEIGHSDAAILNEASLEAAYRHRFEPAYQRDIPVKSRISLRFRFVLHE
jgi:protein TonB